MGVLFVNVTELGGQLLKVLLNSTGRPCLADKFFVICSNFSVKLSYIFFEKLIVPALGVRVVLVEMQEIKANL